MVEAQRAEKGHHLTTVEKQSNKYAKSTLKYFENDPLRFVYESTGEITRFTDYCDPKPRSREVFSFHRPEWLGELMKQQETLCTRFTHIPSLTSTGLGDCQFDAIITLKYFSVRIAPQGIITYGLY